MDKAEVDALDLVAQALVAEAAKAAPGCYCTVVLIRKDRLGGSVFVGTSLPSPSTLRGVLADVIATSITAEGYAAGEVGAIAVRDLEALTRPRNKA